MPEQDISPEEFLARLPFGANVLATPMVRGNANPALPYYGPEAVYVKGADGRWSAERDIHHRHASELRVVRVLYAGQEES